MRGVAYRIVALWQRATWRAMRMRQVDVYVSVPCVIVADVVVVAVVDMACVVARMVLAVDAANARRGAVWCGGARIGAQLRGGV